MDHLTEEQLKTLERVLPNCIPTGPREAMTLSALHVLIDEVRAQRQQLADIRAAVVGTRTYAVNHELSIGECVAWNDLKKLVGIYSDPISQERYKSPASLDGWKSERRTNHDH